MDSQIKTFLKGMNSDLDYRMSQEEVYLDAHNIRILNDTGGTSMSINNIKGNEFNINIPITQKVQKITITGTSSSTLTINGYTGGSFITNGAAYLDLYNYIINIHPADVNVIYSVYYGDNYVYILPLTPIANITSTGSLTINTDYVAASSSPEIIGSTNIRGDIYLFVAANGGIDNKNSQAPTKSIGQIWKYTYDKITFAGSLSLIYNNYINFSTFFCIAPTAVLGRYENPSIQRIYWTDFYNKLRSLNVANSQSLAIDPTVLDSVPSVDFDIPILTNMIGLSGPTIKAGAYQCAYRLTNVGGALTTFSELSNLIFVGAGIEQNNTNGLNFRDYVGAPQGTDEGKQITWIVNNLDRDFDRIEFVIAFKDTLNGSPTLSLLDSLPIDSDSISLTYNGSLPTTPITELEFLVLSGTFTTCKTITTKDNRLIIGNIKNIQQELSFDARAFRAHTSSGNDIWLTQNGTPTLYNQTTANATLDTTDSINDYSSGTHIGLYNSLTNNLGGAGINISYEFVTIASSCDVMHSNNGSYSPPDNFGAPWRFTNQNEAINHLTLKVNSTTNQGTQQEQDYTTLFGEFKINAGMKYPQTNTLLKGFERNEIYRMGIQFYDKSKNPFFVKWIGDIKMPDFWDVNVNAFFEDGTPAVDNSSNPITDFRLAFDGPNNLITTFPEAFIQSLGINFTINNLDTISSLIDGYSIVRVKRTNYDKTIICSGIIHPVVESVSDGNLYMPNLNDNAAGNLPLGGVSTRKVHQFLFVTPNILDGSQIGPQIGMNVNVKALYTNSNSHLALTTGGAQSYYYFKQYNHSNPYNDTFTINELANIDYGETTIDGGQIVFNYDFDTITPNVTLSSSIGNSCYYINIGGGTIDWTSLSSITPYGKYFVTITRSLPTQYGGNTYTARSENEYINCTNYRSIRVTSTPFTDNFYTYSGDVFVNLYDSCRWAKNFGSTGRGQASAKFSATFYFPVESSTNTDLRHAYYMNKNFSGGSGFETEFIEQYLYNPVYSAENDIKTYFPKPDTFLPNKVFDTRIFASDIKINGELIDSWTIFKETNVWDVEGVYGSINAMTILQDKVYFWQDRAFGVMEVNPRAVVTDVNNTSNSNLQIGTGLPLQRHDYISTEVGLQHQWGLTKSSYKLFWMDIANKKFFSYSPGQAITPESDIKGMFSYFINNLTNNILNFDKPVYEGAFGTNGVRAIYDFKFNQVIFTFTDGVNDSNTNRYTLSFDETINAFTSFYDYTPKIYFSDGYEIFSTDPNNTNKIYIHDKGVYGTYYTIVFPSSIKFAFNKDPLITKTWDNFKWDSQVIDISNGDSNQYLNTWNTIRVYTDYQNTDFIQIIPNNNIKRKERTWQLPIFRNRVLNNSSQSPDIFDSANLSPTNKPFGDRLRDKFIAVDLIYNNEDNFQMTTNNVICEFRQSNR